MIERMLHRSHSNHLHRTMQIYEYGTGPVGILIFPTEGGRFFDMETFGIIHACEDILQSGKVRFFCCDSIDHEAIAHWDGPLDRRMAVQTQFRQYILEELHPFLMNRLSQTLAEGEEAKLYTAGCGMGGYQAADVFFHRPESFHGIMAFSAFYDLTIRLDGAINDEIISHSPWHQVYGMTADAITKQFPPFGDLGHKPILLACGDGDWEWDHLTSLKRMEKLLLWKQLPAEVRIFPNAPHDWTSWREQFPILCKKLLI